MNNITERKPDEKAQIQMRTFEKIAKNVRMIIMMKIPVVWTTQTQKERTKIKKEETKIK